MEKDEVFKKLDELSKAGNQLTGYRRFCRRNVDIFIALLEGEDVPTLSVKYSISRSRIYVIFTDQQMLITHMLKKNGHPDYDQIKMLKMIDDCRPKKDVFMRHLEFLIHRYNTVDLSKETCPKDPKAKRRRGPKPKTVEPKPINGINELMSIFCR